MLDPCSCNVVISCWKSGAYGIVICRGGTDMCFVPGSRWKHLDLEQYRISGLTQPQILPDETGRIQLNLSMISTPPLAARAKTLAKGKNSFKLLRASPATPPR